MMKSEAKIQAEIFQKVWNELPQTRRLFFHIPNGGLRPKKEAMTFKAMGVIAGIPDLLLSMPSSGYHGYYIEVKKPGEKPNQKQLQVHEALRAAGYRVEYFDDVDDCFLSIKDYLCNA